jgi:DNA polymerase (family 10)
LAAFLRELPGVQQAEVAGSVRRGRATIGDLDFLVAADDAKPIMAAFVGYPAAARVLAHGPTKSSVELGNGLQADLRVLPAQRWGTLLQYFTGSQAHNVKLRELALRQGLSLSDRSILREDGSEVLLATEEAVYATLGLPWIPPELREDRGEIEAARKGALPRLVSQGDLVSDLHTHTAWSDGALSVSELAGAAVARGLRCLAITDHSQSLGIANGLTPERLRAQRVEIDAARAELGSRLVLLHGTEMEIRADGQLDYSDEVLAGLDVVIASLHSGLRQPREQVTARLLAAIRNPHVDIIGHPTGRLLPDREGADLDMEAVLPAAAAAGVALEINANPARLDLDDPLAFRALQLGCLLSINTDTHYASNFDLAHFGVSLARRAWAAPEQVINTWPVERLRAWLAARDTHAGGQGEIAGAAPRPAGAAPGKPARKRAARRPAGEPKKGARQGPAPKAGRKRPAGR